MKRIIIALLALSLTGCIGGLLSYKGATVTKPENIIMLRQGDQHGVWKTYELTMDYQYRISSDSLKIDGTVKLISGFTAIDRLVVQLLFLDTNGTVIENVVIFSAANNRPIGPVPLMFGQTIPIPPGATSIAFTYDGHLIDSGGGDSTGTEKGYFPS